MVKKLMYILVIVFVILIASVAFVIGRYHYKKQIYTNFWLDQSTQDGELVYVALGDSSATGIGASSPQKSYVGQIAQMYEEKYGKKVKVINLSVPGAKTQDLIDVQISQLKKIKNPDLVTVSIGANDTNHDLDSEKIVKNLEEILQNIPEGSFIAEIPALRGKDRKKTEIINTKLRILASRNNQNVVPLYEALLSQINDLSIYDIDFFHPNDKGYVIWKKSFWSTINR